MGIGISSSLPYPANLVQVRADARAVSVTKVTNGIILSLQDL